VDKNDFLNLLSNPSSITEEDVKELESIIKGHSYSSIPHFLLARYHQTINSSSKDRYLEVASAYALDRKILKNFITNENFQLPEKSGVPFIQTSSATPFIEEQLSDTAEEKLEKEQDVEDNTEKIENSFMHQPFPEVEVIGKAPEINEEDLKQLKERLSSETASKITEEILSEVMSEEYDFFEKVQKDGNLVVEKTPEVPEAPVEQSEKETKEEDLIDRFIRLRPSLIRPTPNVEKDNQEDLAEKGLTYETEIVSENLAVILAKQGKTEKAIDIYKKLIWKYPQKKSYFANRIEELKK
jgi:tetratricopeptide (TPR) repeat protein